MEQTLLAVAAGLAVTALGAWWLHRRRNAQRVAAAGGSTSACGGGTCGC
ncbi:MULTISPECIES: LPXTG cell wall anchor domain-containing protein [unclassified Frankia]|nr:MULTISPECIES: LPXTG cell wall anchor domain-containing protein [unclassified Frankia]